MNSPEFRRLDVANLAKVASIWDMLAPSRYEDIVSGRDRSYTQVLLPLVEEFVKNSNCTSLLDAGCGVGFASKLASRLVRTVDAIDISKVSIDCARTNNGADNIKYHIASAEKYSKNGIEYEVLISSMVLMDCPSHFDFLSACHRMTCTGGKMLFLLCHPSFWPRYWGFEKCKWFSYGAEIAIESLFQTSSTGRSSMPTVYFHRPLSSYISVLSGLGVSDLRIREITGIDARSRVLNRYPRYLTIEVIK